MKTLSEIEKIISQYKKELRKNFQVKQIGIFGSYLHNKQTEVSDIDILVDFGENADLFHLIGLGLFLEEKLGKKVDIVPKRALRKEIKESVLKEAVTV